jgi:hypothetical protein
VANNVPAFEFNTDGSYRGLLVEPGATNLLARSQEFDDAYWTKTTATISANATVAPDGTTTADKLIGNNLSTSSDVARAVTVTTATVYTSSFFAKAGESSWVQLIATGTTGTSPARLWVNLATGALGTNNSGFGTASVQSVGNGWYRISATFTTTGTTTNYIITNATGDNINGFAGDGTSGIFLWQAQLETGSVATSPIVTTAGTANRVADVVSLTGASSLIGQTEGTIFTEVVFSRIDGVVDRGIIELSNTADNRISLLKYRTNRVEAYVRTGGVDQADILPATVYSGTIKIALAYSANDIALYVNGVSVGTDALASIGACDRINIGSIFNNANALNDHVRSVALFPTRLANATLASLTA